MTEALFRQDAYLQDADAHVRAVTPEGGIVLDRSVFYPTGGGQPGDSGRLEWDGGQITIATTVKGTGGGDADDIILVPAEPTPLPAPGTALVQRLDWTRRHRHMRLHTALHLLSVVVPFPVTGGQIGADKARLDFAMPDPIEDKMAIEVQLNALIDRDFPVREQWISAAELDANPQLVKTMSVAPPRGAGRIRLVKIGSDETQIDLQPCGGTHVARTAEIGRIRLGKVEKKGKINRRVSIHLD